MTCVAAALVPAVYQRLSVACILMPCPDSRNCVGTLINSNPILVRDQLRVSVILRERVRERRRASLMTSQAGWVIHG